MEVYTWIVTHWTEITEVIAYVISIATIIVRLTPTLKDDTVMKAIIRFIGKYIALNR
jgi:hypothetical protein